VIAVAAAIYLLDCVVLLERGQALIEARWRGIALSFGSRHYQVYGRSVAFLNPLTPFRAALRSLPLFSTSSGTNLAVAMHAHAPLAIPVGVQFVLVFVALPLCLYRAPGWPFFVALVLAYLNAMLMLLLLVFRFRKNSIPARPLLGLGFGWIVCLPLSVNCLRSAGVTIPLGIDATRAIRFPVDREKARFDLAAQVAEAMQEVEECDARHARLAALARQLETEASRGRL